MEKDFYKDFREYQEKYNTAMKGTIDEKVESVAIRITCKDGTVYALGYRPEDFPELTKVNDVLAKCVVGQLVYIAIGKPPEAKFLPPSEDELRSLQ